MKILFISLGCDKNLVDTEMMLGMLRDKGYTFTDDENDADIIVVNTCCFINDAKEESIEMILAMAEHKKEKCKALIVSGCLAQRYQKEIREEIPEVDAVIGTSSYDTIVETVEKVLKGEYVETYLELNRLPLVSTRRVVTTGGHFAYLKIAEGCDKNCTYCIIPKIRGKYRSYPMENLLEQAKELVSSGAKELILVAQETTLYGKDLYGEKSLHLLLNKLCEIEELEWIRILYCYPEEIYDELIDTIANQSKICKYLDIPIQHGDDTILKRMGRRTTSDDLRKIITKLREKIPGIALRTTLITGFPGETEAQFENLLDFVDEMEFDRLGVFTYSSEEDTPASIMKEQVDEEVKSMRRDAVMELQQMIAFDNSLDKVGQVLKVMIEGKLEDEDVYVGRTYMDAPNVDGFIFVSSPEEIMTGDFVYAKVTGAKEYDLIGERDYEFTE